MQLPTNIGIPAPKVSSLRAEALTAEMEQELVGRAKNGSTDAFVQLVERYQPRILRTAYSITRHREDAEDVTQNTLLIAFDKLPMFRGDSRFSTWLVRITINEALMRMRRRHRAFEISIDESTESADAVAPGCGSRTLWPNPEEYSSYSQLHSVFTSVLNTLKPKSRLVFQLREIEGLSTRETAEALNLTVAAVKARSYRARMILRRSLHGFIRSGNRARMQCASSASTAGL
jgi:RNA polymerase sigma-70 factor (ECF subfamily)